MHRDGYFHQPICLQFFRYTELGDHIIFTWQLIRNIYDVSERKEKVYLSVSAVKCHSKVSIGGMVISVNVNVKKILKYSIFIYNFISE